MERTIFDLQYLDTVSQLSKSIIEGNLKELKRLLLSGKLPQATDNRGWTAIHYCAASNQLEALKLILKMKAKNKKYLVNLTTWENFTPLVMALKSQSPSPALVRVLLQAGANPNLLTHTKLSPLHLACIKKGGIEFVKLLVEHGANVNVQEDISNSTPLHLAAREAKDVEVVKYLLRVTDLTIKNCHGRTAFFETCMANFTEGVRAFIEFDENLAKTKCDVPSLVQISYFGNLEAADLLIKAGANVNERCKALVSDPEESKSDWIILDVENYLPIHSALNNLELFKLLLNKTCHTELTKLNSSYCNFPLFLLIFADDVACLELLLKSHYPDELKIISSKTIVNFFVKCSWEMTLAVKKFRTCFKYNFDLNPDDVFHDFASLLTSANAEKNLKFLFHLAEMGVTSSEQLRSKQNVIQILNDILNDKNLNNEDCELVRITQNFLSSTVLSLKQLCRTAVRRYIQIVAKNQWMAVTIVEESKLPESLKKFLFFEV